jgi:hypothetical protein
MEGTFKKGDSMMFVVNMLLTCGKSATLYNSFLFRRQSKNRNLARISVTNSYSEVLSL